MINVKVSDGQTDAGAKVTSRGQLVTAPLDFSVPYFKAMTVNDQVYNFLINDVNKLIVITDVIAFGDRSVGTNGSVVNIYEATASDSGTITKEVLRLDIGKNSSFVATGLNYVLSQGVFLNAKQSDNNVNLTIGAYRINL